MGNRDEERYQGRLLVVDDEAPVAQMIARAVRAAHPEYEVIEANDGFRAGTIIASQQPDVVILDLRMPGMDGYEVCSLIKSQDTTKHVESKSFFDDER